MQVLTATGVLSALLIIMNPIMWSDTVKTYRPWNIEQSYLDQISYPPLLASRLATGRAPRLLHGRHRQRTRPERDHSRHRRQGRSDLLPSSGEKPYSPVMMVSLLLYAYCVGVFSSRRIERATYEDIAFRMITADQHPDHSRISEFRRTHLDAIAGLFKQTVQLCQQAGLVKLGTVAIDGTKIQGNASKHKAMSYERMRH